jgi:hypothetical protein
MSSPVSDEVFDLLSTHPWSETLPRLRLHVSYKMNSLRWCSSRNGSPPGGQQVDDFIQEVIAKVLEGKRVWNPQVQPDLYLFLKDQVDSEISNLVRAPQNRCVISESSIPAEVREDKRGYDEETPESILIKSQEEDESDAFLLGLCDYLHEEPMLQKIVEAFMEGITKRAELAEYVGILPHEFDACKKRLRRRIEEFHKKAESREAPTMGGRSI